MTNPTPHGQVPEALRLAEQYDHGDPAAHGNAWKAAVCTELRRLAELEAQIEALSGVQALSAAPAVPAGWKAVPVNPTPEMWKAAKTVPDPNPPYPPHYGLVWDAMLAATPTPPEEQQAAPKAAPGDAIDEALRERDEAEDFINELLDEVLGADRPEWSSAYNRYDAMSDVRERITALHKPAVNKAWGQFQSAMAAPQQEAQEPVATLHCNDIGYVWARATEVGKLMRFEQPLNLYTAPQPAPAPLSDEAKDAMRWRETLMHIGAANHLGGQHFTLNTLRISDQMFLLRGSASQHFTKCIDESIARRAAIAAQGGKV